MKAWMNILTTFLLCPGLPLLVIYVLLRIDMNGGGGPDLPDDL